MDMYIANATKHAVEFAYRLPERSGVITQRVPIGGQVKLSGDLSTTDIDAVVKQYSKYGLIKADDIDISKGAFTGLCYSVGRAVHVDKIRRAMERNEDVLEELGQQMRKEAAVAANNQIEGDTGSPLKTLDMSVRELEPSGGFKDEGLTHVDENIRVTRDAGAMATPAKKPSYKRS
jgi:hypothetical protein